MKKVLFILSVALLSLTACHCVDDFDFLVGEDEIAFEFFYDQVVCENTDVQERFGQILVGKQDALEMTFVREVNDELDNVGIVAYRINPTSTIRPNVDYIFQIYILDVTAGGISTVDVHVFDRLGHEVTAFVLSTHRELDRSFTERVFDSFEELGERLGKDIRLGV